MGVTGHSKDCVEGEQAGFALCGAVRDTPSSRSCTTQRPQVKLHHPVDAEIVDRLFSMVEIREDSDKKRAADDGAAQASPRKKAKVFCPIAFCCHGRKNNWEA
jgi:hypothetical protein